MTVAGKRKGVGGAGRYQSTKAAKTRSVASLPGTARRGKSKIVRTNPMAHGGNC
jgi:hypothetical protein